MDSSSGSGFWADYGQTRSNPKTDGPRGIALGGNRGMRQCPLRKKYTWLVLFIPPASSTSKGDFLSGYAGEARCRK